MPGMDAATSAMDAGPADLPDGGGSEADASAEADSGVEVDSGAVAPIPDCTRYPARSSMTGERHELCDTGVRRDRESAEAYCFGLGGHIVKLETIEEAMDLVAYAAANGLRDVRIGLNDVAEEGTFVWHDGTPLTYSFWRADRPDDFGDEDCVAFNYLVEGGRFDDVGCDWTWPIICEFP